MDPRELGPKPPFPKQQQRYPGSIFRLSPPADHGETSYSGESRLSGRVAIITGQIVGLAERSPLHSLEKEQISSSPTSRKKRRMRSKHQR